MARSAEPTSKRRRGAELEQAILAAAVQELQRSGYHELTMEAVAARAGASKNSVYRRWPTKRRLALAAVRDGLTGTADLADTGALRSDLLAILRSIATQLDGPTGVALRVVVAESVASADRSGWLRDHGASTSTAMMAEIADRADQRGEIDRSTITERALEVGPAMLRNHFLFGGLPISEALLTSIVDEVIIPLWTTGSGR
ncbi:TetR/AcrR family transcriptional regulator [Microlunatus soli]|uniref:DNA-binding transcriptional regulator, AcrR family n=1 Tax=Microlunatus soli TaxID=630515 RepID=A0A1H1ZFV3_9ACTN|nr:TetR/AcrR family transcriptional regulator [Microlunatus soli]SDT32372.1 DNA-binding transcriptional regulator, AcrR family [Microlunatus soli]